MLGTQSKLCECGCGGLAPISNRDYPLKGWVKGQPKRYIMGHGRRGRQFAVIPYSPEYRIYLSAQARCSNPKDKAWEDYGARGIKFLFTSFAQFFAELGPRPAGDDARGKALYSLDRIENDGNYEPGNVRWATRSEQLKNRRPFSEEHRHNLSLAKRSKS